MPTEIRKQSQIPLILFSYLNPILAALNDHFAQKVQQAGIDGVLIVDAPIEESSGFAQQFLAHNIAPIYVIAPTTPLARIRAINQSGKGFLYYACRKGTTGMRTELPADFVDKIQLIKSNVHLPVVTGFGISNIDTAKQVLQYADGVVVGSLFVKALEGGIQSRELTDLTINLNPLVR